MLEGISQFGYHAIIKIKEFEHVERIKDNQYAHEERTLREMHDFERFKITEKNKAASNANTPKKLEALVPIFIIFSILIFWLIGFMPPYLEHKSEVKELARIESEIEEAILIGDFITAEKKVNQLRSDGNWSREETNWNNKREYYTKLINEKKKEAYIAENTIPAPAAPDYYIGKKTDTVVNIFKDAGFINIECIETTETKGLFTSSNSVEHVSINGIIEFTVDSYFDSEAKVAIYYYN